MIDKRKEEIKERLKTELRLAIMEFPITTIWKIVEEITCEVSDYQWETMPLPKFMKARGYTQKYLNEVSIIKIAKEIYKLNVSNNGMCVCPFHDDTDPSLKFYDDKGNFYCYGCHAYGNTVEFVKKMEAKKNGQGNDSSD